jgi:hypothetical protein
MPDDVDSEIGCPTCGWVGRRRDLYTEYSTISKCRRCEAVVESTNAWRYRETDLILADEVSCLEACAAEIADALDCRLEEDRRNAYAGRWGWVFAGVGNPWECRIAYRGHQSGVVRVCLLALEDSPSLSGEIRRLVPVAAKHGVEFGGLFSAAVPGAWGLAPRLPHLEVWWGVHQIVGVTALSLDLFSAIFPRLQAAMEELAPIVRAINGER